MLNKLFMKVPDIGENTVGSYAVAISAAGIATAVRFALDPYLGDGQYGFFYLAVTATALLSGVRAGLACAVFSAGPAYYFFIEPRGTIWFVHWKDIAGVILFSFVSIFLAVLAGALRNANRRYRELNQTLEEHAMERSRALLAAQERLAQSQKMDVLGQLTAGLAHDFNNMNAVVIGNLDLMRLRIPGGDPRLMKYLDNAMDGAKRAAALTQRLLAFARRQPLAPAVTEIGKLARDMSELLRRTLGERIKLKCITSENLWKAYVDSNQLENAILNLAVNARDAMPGGGTLTIETSNACLDECYATSHGEVTPGEYAVIAVSDTGHGMAPEVLEHAIEPFFTTKERGHGSGLGLSQVYGFVKQSGGHLAVYSEEGRGTTVRIYLPRADTGAAEAGQKTAVQKHLPLGSRSECILIVEDDERVRRMGATALRELGYEVFDASNSEDALKILKQERRIGLLFTDLVMPGMDGLELAKTARAVAPDIHVVYATGYAQNSIIQEGTGDALICKPFTIEELALKVRSVLDSGKGIPEAKEEFCGYPNG